MEVELNKYGFYNLVNKPSQKEIEEYYENKYYQNASGNYEQQYSDNEIKYFRNKIVQKFYIINQYIQDIVSPRFLDIGCGEGWTLKFFKDKGWKITGLDYTNYGCEKFNPDCKKYIITGDVNDNLNLFIKNDEQFNVIWLDNVLEHVLDPELLIISIKKVTAPGGLLVIEVPNDFSVLQQYLLDNGCIDRRYWIAIPDHISYFNRTGLESLLQSVGWKALCFLSDYPIDWNLLNPDTNYIMDKTKGKNCHNERIQFENLLHAQGVEKALPIYKALAEAGLGRQVIGFFQIS